MGSEGCALILELRLEEEAAAVCFLEAAVGIAGLKGVGEMGGHLCL